MTNRHLLLLLAVALASGCDPLPTSVTTQIGPEGETIELAGGAAVSFPSGAVDQTVEVVIEVPDELASARLPALPSWALTPAESVLVLGPTDLTLNTPVGLQLPYDTAEEELILLRLDETDPEPRWRPAPNLRFADGQMTTELDQLGVYALVEAMEGACGCMSGADVWETRRLLEQEGFVQDEASTWYWPEVDFVGRSRTGSLGWSAPDGARLELQWQYLDRCNAVLTLPPGSSEAELESRFDALLPWNEGSLVYTNANQFRWIRYADLTDEPHSEACEGFVARDAPARGDGEQVVIEVMDLIPDMESVGIALPELGFATPLGDAGRDAWTRGWPTGTEFSIEVTSQPESVTCEPEETSAVIGDRRLELFVRCTPN